MAAGQSMMSMRILVLLLPALMLMSGCSIFSGSGSTAATSEKVSGHISVAWRNNLDQRQPATPPGFSLPATVATNKGEMIVAGAQDRRVRIYNAKGSEVERIAIEAAGESGGLKLSNGLVVVGDVGGMLYGLDIAQAKVAWSQQLTAALIGTPVAVDNDFIVQTSNNQIYRFTAAGKKVWSFSGSRLGGLGMHLYPSPAVYNNRIYSIFSNGDVVALKTESGSLLWKRQLLLSNKASVLSELKVPVSTPVVIPASQSGADEDVLLVSVFQDAITFLALQDGSTKSRRGISLKSSPLLVGKRIFLADASGAVSALNANGGDTLWKKTISQGELTGPVLWQGSLWVADDQARVYRLSQDGRLLARTRLDGRIDRAPVTAENGVLVRNNLGTLYLLR